MPRFQHFLRSIPAIAALVFVAGCSSGVSPTATDTLSSQAALAQDAIAQNSIDPFAEGIKYATRATNLGQTARSATEWDEVSKQWLQAIYWMQSVPPSSPRRAFAQKKVAEYMRYLTYAQQQATVSSRLSYPSFGSDVLDEQLGLYLSYLEAMGRPDVLIVGSSRALQGVDPSVLEQALAARGLSGLKVFNFGVNGATAQVVNFQLRQLLTPEQLPRMILWADGVRAFNSGRLDRTYNEILRSPGYQRLASGVRPSWTSGNRTETATIRASLPSGSDASHCALSGLRGQAGAIASEIGVQSNVQNVSFQRSLSSPHLTPPSWKIATAVAVNAMGKAIDAYGFLPVSQRFNPSSYYRQRQRVAGLYDGDYANFQLGGIQGAALDSVVALARGRQIPLVVVNLPLTNEYLDATRSSRVSEFRQYMRGESYQSFLWRDLSVVSGLRRNDYFEDPSHLNLYGAAAVARQLAADSNIPWPRVRN